MCLGCIKLNYLPCNRTLSSPFLLVLKSYVWLYPIKPQLNHHYMNRHEITILLVISHYVTIFLTILP